ncbi:MAG: signal recognition particle-docking protein FtsY [Treponema sp.]|jgi:fused signal recognition particle receptor|nr:signal recognition particle-docking protein FtsY [Treponema sp.]
MKAFSAKLAQFFNLSKGLSDDDVEALTDLLVEGDFGAAEAYSLAEKLQASCRKEGVSGGDAAKLILSSLLSDILLTVPQPPLNLSQGKLSIVLMLGVNGVGKTTSAAKLASRYMQTENRKPIMAAADTFRAAAINQLKIHGQRLGVRVVAHQQGGDPAAVIYDAIEAANAGGGDLIIADTAGRMHTKAALVEELKKIDRIVESRASGCDYIKYLVLDSTTGRNALAQAEIFKDAVSPDGVILTKYDSSAKGGAVFSLAKDLRLPVVFLCSGEKYSDITPFDPKSYAKEFSNVA